MSSARQARRGAAGQEDLGLEPGDVGGGVGRSANDVAPFLEFDDGDGRLRRDAADAAPEVLVQHHVANYQESLAREPLQDVVQGAAGAGALATFSAGLTDGKSAGEQAHRRLSRL
jgi:hypothetical protein